MQNTFEEISTELFSNLMVKTEIATHKPRKYKEFQRDFVGKRMTSRLAINKQIKAKY